MGRGSSGAGSSWKNQLKKMAKSGRVPTSIFGNRDQQAEILREIDRLYDMPETNNRIVYGDGQVQVWHMDGSGRTSRATYPSGDNASEEEKRGALKWLLHKIAQK